MPHQVEQHDRKFQGTFASKALHDLVEQGTISPTEAWLVMVISSLSSDERGCFASNGFLGRSIHRDERSIQRMLQTLEKAGLLHSEWHGEERRLFIDWSASSTSKRKKTYRKKARHDKNVVSDTTKTSCHDTTKMSYRKRIGMKGNREGANPPASGGSDVPIPTTLKSSKKEYDEECRSGASHLRKALQENNKQTKGRNAGLWEEPLRLLRDVDKQKDWMKVLRWYCRQLLRLKELRLPRIANGKEFREQYGWVERIYDREMDEGGYIPPPPKDEKRFCIYGNTRS